MTTDHLVYFKQIGLLYVVCIHDTRMAYAKLR